MPPRDDTGGRTLPPPVPEPPPPSRTAPLGSNTMSQLAFTAGARPPPISHPSEVMLSENPPQGSWDQSTTSSSWSDSSLAPTLPSQDAAKLCLLITSSAALTVDKCPVRLSMLLLPSRHFKLFSLLMLLNRLALEASDSAFSHDELSKLAMFSIIPWLAILSMLCNSDPNDDCDFSLVTGTNLLADGNERTAEK